MYRKEIYAGVLVIAFLNELAWKYGFRCVSIHIPWAWALILADVVLLANCSDNRSYWQIIKGLVKLALGVLGVLVALSLAILGVLL